MSGDGDGMQLAGDSDYAYPEMSATNHVARTATESGGAQSRAAPW